MAFYKVIQNPIRKNFKNHCQTLGILSRKSSTAPLNELDVENPEEIKIPVPWGHISAVRWGDSNKKPILSIHGWQDNAFTFKPLIPYLSKDISLLAIDVPGQGLSSRYPHGMSYSMADCLMMIKRILNYLGYESIPLMGHSMGAYMAFLYSSFFPKDIDFSIQLDHIKPHTFKHPQKIDQLSKDMEKFLIDDNRNITKSERPAYTIEEMELKIHNGVFKGSIPLDKCKYLMERGIKESPKNPGRYHFTLDGRVKYTFFHMSQSDVIMMAKRHNSPLMYIKFSDSKYLEPKALDDEVMDIFRHRKESFEEYYVPGTHHGHLCNPHLVAPLINSFAAKYAI